MNFTVFIKKLIPIFILGLICVVFYHRYFLFGLIPFPGDLLASEYQPFRSYSYEGYVEGSIPHKAQYFDSIREFYPWRTFTTDELKKGNLPLWNPHDFSGAPHMANYLTAVFYPINVLYLFLNQMDAWAILVLLQPFLASLFTYMYLKKIGLSAWSAVFGGLVYAYSSYMNVWLQFNVIGHTILWLPLILYSIELLLAKVNLVSVGLITLSITSSAFAGHPLDFGAVYTFSLVYLMYRLLQHNTKRSRFITLLAVFHIPILVALIQIIPTVKLLLHSTRSVFSYEFMVNNLLVQPSQFAMIVVPDFFGNPATRNYWPETSYVGITLSVGIVPLIVLLFLFTAKKRVLMKHFNFFLYATLIVLLLTTKNPVSLLLYKIQIPVLSTIQPNKLFSIMMLSLAVLSGHALEHIKSIKLLGNKQVLTVLSILFITLTVLVLEAYFVATKGLTVALKNTFLSFTVALSAFGFIVLFIKVKHAKFVVFILLFALFLSEQYYAFQKFNPFSPRAFIFPETPVITFLKEKSGIDRYWGYGTAKIDSNIATQYKLFSSDGFGALNLKSYNEFIRTSESGKIPREFTHETRSVAEIAPGYGETDLPSNKYRLKVLDAMGTKYIIDRVENPQNDSTFPPDRFRLVWQDTAGWKIYENLKRADRFFLTNQVKTYSSTEEFEMIFFNDEFDPRTMVLVDQSAQVPPLCNDSDQQMAQINLVAYESNEVKFRTTSDCTTFLFLSDTFDYNWQVRIDDELASLVKTNYAFRGVVIPSGDHSVVFSYSLL